MTPEISPVHIWRATTGGGLPVDYLRWLASQWELYESEPPSGAGQEFNEWLAARFTTSTMKD